MALYEYIGLHVDLLVK